MYRIIIICVHRANVIPDDYVNRSGRHVMNIYINNKIINIYGTPAMWQEPC